MKSLKLDLVLYLTFIGLCIVIYTYNKANKLYYFSTLFGKELYMFRADLLSIVRRLCIVFTRKYNKMDYFSNFVSVKNSTCFGQIYCPSSGDFILYS